MTKTKTVSNIRAPYIRREDAKTNRSGRKISYKTVSFYLALFLVTYIGASTLLMNWAAASETDCGLELNDPDEGFLYAYGKNNNTVDNYDKAGLFAMSNVTDPEICGTYQTDGSVGGGIMTVSYINTLWIELGWYKGNYTDTQSSMNAINETHYFRGYKQSGGSFIYTDISNWADVVPTTNHWANFTLNGDPRPGYYLWNATIESNDHDTLVLQTSMTDNTGGQTSVMLEMHNNKSLATAYFKDIQNAKIVGGSLDWVPWGGSDASVEPPQYSSWNKLQSHKVDVDEYCMDTDEDGWRVCE
jgi:hypothetical protein